MMGHVVDFTEAWLKKQDESEHALQEKELQEDWAFAQFTKDMAEHLQRHPHLSLESLSHMLVILTADLLAQYPQQEADEALEQILEHLPAILNTIRQRR